MKINIVKTLEFFDYTPKSGLATSIVGLIGEDLNAWAFKHYMENERNAEVKILPDNVSTGQKKGKRLDRWIYVKERGKETLYQCEIKNWSSTAIGGKRLRLDADLNEKQKITKHYWEHQIKTEFSNKVYPNGVTKVLVEMKRPEQYKDVKIEPLIIYWMPISNTDKLDPFFKVSVSSFNNSNIQTTFKELNVFSVSLYLRELNNKISDKTIFADLNNVKDRLDILGSIINN